MSVEEIIESGNGPVPSHLASRIFEFLKRGKGSIAFSGVHPPCHPGGFENRRNRAALFHQVDAIEVVHEGKDIVVVSPTASGKTLCYNLPY